MPQGIELDKALHLSLFDEEVDIAPCYSEDFELCGRILKKISEDVFFFNYAVDMVGDCDDSGNDIFYWSAKFAFDTGSMSYDFRGTAGTIPLAICRAALEYINLSQEK